MELIPLILVLVPVICAIAIYLVHSLRFNRLVWLNQVVLLALLALHYPQTVEASDTRLLIGGWSQHIGISLRVDQLSFSFMLLAVVMWTAIALYEWGNRAGDSKFWFFLLFLQGVFLVIVQTDDLFNLFVGVELATIISTILIFYAKDSKAIQAGLYYLIFNTVGIMLYLLGLGLVYRATGTLNMQLISTQIAGADVTTYLNLGFILMAVAMGVKSAFFPVFNWLPKAHGAAPVAISALLSGLLVKTGLYGFIRIHHMFGDIGFSPFFLVLGFVSSVAGLIFALSQTDIKQILAFSTISQVGLALMGVSMRYGPLFTGGVFHIFNHAIFKALLFLGAGVVIKEYNTQDVREIRGVAKRLPLCTLFMVVGILSITGSPLFNGYVSKSILGYGLKDTPFYVMLVLINVGTVVYFLKIVQMFMGDAQPAQRRYISENGALALLSLLSILVGLYYSRVSDFLWGLPVDFVTLFAVKDWLVYGASIAVGFVLYSRFVKTDPPVLRRLRSFPLHFTTANTMLIAFILLMIFYGLLSQSQII